MRYLEGYASVTFPCTACSIRVILLNDRITLGELAAHVGWVMNCKRAIVADRPFATDVEML